MPNLESVAQKMAELLNFETSKFGNIAAAVAVAVVVGRVTTEVALDPGNQLIYFKRQGNIIVQTSNF